ncbi:transmembrane protein 256-like [Stegastes partitus]|uniref:Transmembrane protein 256-like n=1 Tax=Stegastes partitus TaxID=144197 RepID=A0A9Y4JUI7_9TELE|nr:PREDICTED: transmembrane protein 256-like [Stegastes partitus]
MFTSYVTFNFTYCTTSRFCSIFVISGFKNSDPDDYQRVLFETANKYHFYHSLALLGAAHSGKPAVAGTILIAGMGMFCGSLYHQALTGDPGLRKVAPMGGVAMIVGWLAMIL